MHGVNSTTEKKNQYTVFKRADCGSSCGCVVLNADYQETRYQRTTTSSNIVLQCATDTGRRSVPFRLKTSCFQAFSARSVVNWNTSECSACMPIG